MPPVPDRISTGTSHLPKPTSAQLSFQDLELGLFVHYGMGTYTGSDNRGRDDPHNFRPQEVDCDNWMRTAKAMGARFAVFTTRHEEGFCLWPTRTTAYSVSSSPYRDGRGDIVREFVEACRRHDIKPCLYHPSFTDAHHVFQPGDPITWYEEWFRTTNGRLGERGALERFIAMQREQLHELLTDYGDITYLWLDHMTETQGILSAPMVTQFWDAITEEARHCQPDCLLLKCDVYLSRDGQAQTGVHGGRAAYPLWYACRREDTERSLREPIPDPINGTQYVVWESNTIFSGNWFWDGETRLKSVDDMLEHYYATVGRGATFLPNFAPSPDGRMTKAVLKSASEFGERVRAIYGRPVAVAVDGVSSAELRTNSQLVTHLEIMEDLTDGQKIAAYRIDTLKNGKWELLLEGESVGHKRLHRLDGIVVDNIRFSCTQELAPSPRVRRFAAYR